VVFGHSHDPVDEVGVDGQLLLNPGSPTWKRRAPHPTVAVLDLADGQIRHHAIVTVRGEISALTVDIRQPAR
jgi:predicted phosphodiesterase